VDTEVRQLKKLRKQVETILDNTVPLLGLQGWSFHIEPSTAQEVRVATGKDSESYAVIFLDKGRQEARILINKEDISELEHTVVHELVHAVATDVGLESEKGTELNNDAWETFLNRIASSLLRAKERNVRRPVRH